MANTTKLFAIVLMITLFANLSSLSSTTEPTISPQVSSFFSNPTTNSLAPSEADSSAMMVPSSGEFVGKKISSSTRLRCEAAIVGVLLCGFLRVCYPCCKNRTGSYSRSD
ncbi:uncharacterized protein G2W53_040936 [Senna tora]|uniref:Uncharacterized protein n=1 Tax=Senna tora TaxID=362788 RepID=A0A834SG88_9FABA|nr:uncharacterized protein G2W53_040936 [Senna tora]